MAIKKSKHFKLFSSLIDKIIKSANNFNQHETTIVEAALEFFFSLPEDKQEKILADFLVSTLKA